MLYKVVIRRNLAEVKTEAEQIDGMVFEFTEGWVMSKSDTFIYIGETAMLPMDNTYPKDAPVWIASGDLQAAPQEAEDLEVIYQ